MASRSRIFSQTSSASSVPALHALEPSRLLRLLRRRRRSASGVLAEFLSAALNQQAMLWRTSPAATELEEVSLGWLRRLLGLPDSFEGVIYDTASISSLHALAARAASGGAGRARAGAGGPFGSRAAPRLLFRAGALIDRQGRADARSRPLRRSGAFRQTTPSACGSMRCAPRSMRTARDGVTPVAVVAHHRHDVDDRRRSGRRRSPTSAASTPSGCTSTPHMQVSTAMLPECASHFTGWERADSIVINPAQVAVHAVRSQRLLLPPHGRGARGVLARPGISEDRRRIAPASAT